MCNHHLTATVYDKKGRILAIGENSFQKTHPKQKKWAQMVGGRHAHREFLHAEIRAIIRALKKGKPYKIKVERYTYDGEPALAKPCPICEIAIAEAGIKLIEYTVS
jgi:deoxycytidylate deaminase